MAQHPDSCDTVFAVRTALRDVVGGVGRWDGRGFTNEDDQLIGIEPGQFLTGRATTALLDEATGLWRPSGLNVDEPDEVSGFLRGEVPDGSRNPGTPA